MADHRTRQPPTPTPKPILDYRGINAVMETFWARMQVELLDRRRWRTCIELANAIFEYLEIFPNLQPAAHRPPNAFPDRIRDNPPQQPACRTTTPNELTPQNQGTIRA